MLRHEVAVLRGSNAGNDMYRDVYGARQAGMATVMFDSDQGTKEYPGCVPDHTVTDHRQLLTLLGLDPPPRRHHDPRRYPPTPMSSQATEAKRPRPGPGEVPERHTCLRLSPGLTTRRA
jgi:hypothetical protein